MERWLFLQNEPLEKLCKFTNGFGDLFNDEWVLKSFSENGISAERPSIYLLTESIGRRGDTARDVKLVIGIDHLGPKIRFRYGGSVVVGDFMVPETPENYTITNDLFRNTFGCSVEDYSSQDTRE
jgi:hypothetical protein